MNEKVNLFGDLDLAFKDALQNLKEQMEVVAFEAMKNAVLRLKDEDLSDWISKEQAFEILGYGTTKMQDLRSSGELAFSKIGNKLYYSKISVIGLIENNRRV